MCHRTRGPPARCRAAARRRVPVPLSAAVTPLRGVTAYPPRRGRRVLVRVSAAQPRTRLRGESPGSRDRTLTLSLIQAPGPAFGGAATVTALNRDRGGLIGGSGFQVHCRSLPSSQPHCWPTVWPAATVSGCFNLVTFSKGRVDETGPGGFPSVRYGPRLAGGRQCRSTVPSSVRWLYCTHLPLNFNLTTHPSSSVV